MKAVIYARYSSHSQTEQSIEGQLRDNHLWAQQQGVTVVGEYIDRALTGTRDQRPDFQRMIADAARRQFEMVIVWKLDRFARNRYDSAVYKARLKKYGVRVVSVKENITDTPEGIILEGLLESMAEYYSANLSQNIRRGLRESISKGFYCGGGVPYGYKLVDRKLVADEKTAPIIRYVFERYAAGVPKKQIITELTARGIRSQRGHALRSSSFQTALTNRTYIGEFSYNGVVIPGLAERLIDDVTFERAQEQVRRHARAPAAEKAKVSYLLQGKVFCGHCGAPMIGESGKSKTGNVYHYYKCATRKRQHACDKQSERKEDIEQYVVDQTLRYILTPSNTARVAAAVVQEYRREFSDTRIDDMEKAVRQIDRDLDKLLDTMMDTPKAMRQRIADRMEALTAQKEELEADITRLRIASRITLSEAEVRSWLHTFSGGDPADEDFRVRVIDTFINAIYLYDDKVVIFYNIRGGKQVSYTDLINSAAISTTESTSECSDLTTSSPPNASKSEPQYVFVNGVFGCVFNRMKGVN